LDAKITAVVPVCNGAATLGRAIDSALSQTLAPAQIVVVDDGSTDETPTVLSKYRNRITVVRQKRSGPSAARNAGVLASPPSEFVAFLDADDAWHPDMLRVLADTLKGDRVAVLAYSDVDAVDESGRGLAVQVVPEECAFAPSLNDLLRQWWPILPSAAVLRRDAYEEVGGFHASFRAPGFEDPYLWMQMREIGPFAYVNRRLATYCLPPAPARMEKYENGYKIFDQLVCDRYGVDGRRLIANVRHAFISAWGFEGLKALNAGDKYAARRAFRCALRYNAFDMRTLLRWARTFLPLRAALALSGGYVTRASSDSSLDGAARGLYG